MCARRSGRSGRISIPRRADLPRTCFAWQAIAVDRNVLRGAVAEFLGYPATPRAIVINEAIEIARKFSSPESVTFINGVLDSVGKEIGA